MNLMEGDVASFPLIGSIQNSVGMGFLGNQAAFAIANALGTRVVHAVSSSASGHGGVAGRSSAIADPQQFRRDVQFVIAQRPGILLVGYLPKPAHVDIVATALQDYKGVVLLDPVIGDYKKGLYVGEATALAIRDQLLPLAQIATPNRFEAEVLTGGANAQTTEYDVLNGLFDLGPEAVIVTSFDRDAAKHRTKTLFTNGYSYYAIEGQYFPAYPAHGAGDIFAAAVTVFAGLGGSPFASALLATALASRAVANTTNYGGATADPVAALAKWNPSGYQVDDDKAIRFCERSGVEAIPIKPAGGDAARLKFAPPKHKIMYG